MNYRKRRQLSEVTKYELMIQRAVLGTLILTHIALNKCILQLFPISLWWEILQKNP